MAGLHKPHVLVIVWAMKHFHTPEVLFVVNSTALKYLRYLTPCKSLRTIDQLKIRENHVILGNIGHVKNLKNDQNSRTVYTVKFLLILDS